MIEVIPGKGQIKNNIMPKSVLKHERKNMKYCKPLKNQMNVLMNTKNCHERNITGKLTSNNKNEENIVLETVRPVHMCVGLIRSKATFKNVLCKTSIEILPKGDVDLNEFMESIEERPTQVPISHVNSNYDIISKKSQMRSSVAFSSRDKKYHKLAISSLISEGDIP